MSAATSLTERNRAIVEAMFEAANKGDVERVVSYLSDDVTVDEPLFLPFRKVYRGKDEFLGLAQVLPDYLDVSAITLHYTIADGDGDRVARSSLGQNIQAIAPPRASTASAPRSRAKTRAVFQAEYTPPTRMPARMTRPMTGISLGTTGHPSLTGRRSP
jgi:ketosteroid isomerase-like protein